jgi:hypothetical protein
MSKLFFSGEGAEAKMLAQLKSTFIEPVGSSDISLCDRILNLDFEYLLEHRYEPAYPQQLSNMEALSKCYDLCSKLFSLTYETDPDLVKKFAEVGMHCEVLILAF